MCGRYAVTLPPEAMRDLFRTANMIEYPARYNVAPTQPVLTIRESDGARSMQFARWGLVPAGLRDPRKIPLLINARSETIATRAPFKDALARHRCIVPASGYYEWLTGADGHKQPYYITMADNGPMAFAGLYTIWEGPTPDGTPIETVAIVTTDAGPDTAHIHGRAPAVLRGDEVARWLETRGIGSAEAAALTHPLPAGTMVDRPVSIHVNSARNDAPNLIYPVTPEQIAAEKAERASPRKKKAAGGGGQLDLF